MSSKKLVIVGAGGHSKSVADTFLQSEPKSSVVFVDITASPGKKILGHPVINETKDHIEGRVIIAIGDNKTRKRVFDKYAKFGFTNVVSNSSHIGINAKLGHGNFIANFTLIGPDSVIGDNNIVNNGAIIEHEAVVGSHCHFAPCAVVSGQCKVGDNVFMGVGSKLINNISVCSNVVIGAGATVIKDITEPGTYVGSPAAKIK
ncbi:MAG: acetyltransferase [Cytophagaceae bacterium]|jgi:sugar O-acyltransferase (sialic acid O-acetyltransferase NeuD family)|nr:acetyltransferase [Cytophagaceae bacterium]